MRNALAIARRELGSYFLTPWAWIVLAAMMLLASFFFTGMLTQFQEVQEVARERGWARLPQIYRNLTDGVVIQLFGAMMVITVFISPFVSMRLFAEERRQKTFELLMTAPVRPFEIVLGKYLGGVAMMGTTVGTAIVFPVVLSVFGSGQSGSAVEWSTVLLGYAALLIWAATCVAVGMFISSLTETQFLAALLTLAVLLPLWLLRALTGNLVEPVRTLLNQIAFERHLTPILSGELELQSLVFFGSVIVVLLFLTHRRIEAFRWA